MPDRSHALVVAELAEAGLAAASLVHELRQPTFAIKALAQLAQRAGSLEGAALADLLDAVVHLERLLDAWTDVGRSDPPALYDLREVAHTVGRLLGPRLARVDAELRIDAGEPIWAHGGPGVARQVLLNLVQNAVDAVEGRPERVIHVGFVADGVRGVVVADSGAGLDTDAAELFAPFVTTKGRQGTGLGLYVTRALCEAAGGELTLVGGPIGAVATARFVSPPAVDP